MIDITISTEMAGKPAVVGTWQNIRWKPNESTGEVINIGVLFKNLEGVRYVRCIDVFDRLACMYDASFVEQARFLIRVVRDVLSVGAELPSGNVVLSEPKFASGGSPDSIVNSLFAATVPLGAKKRVKVDTISPVASVPDTASVRKQVFAALREIAGIRAEAIISSERTLQVSGQDGRLHYLDIPLQSSKALGTIVSVSSSRASDELQLLRADSDLQVARHIYSQDALLMYVVRPTHEVAATANRFDDFLDGLHWKFQQIGVQMKSYTEPVQVARDILEDMPVG